MASSWLCSPGSQRTSTGLGDRDVQETRLQSELVALVQRAKDAVEGNSPVELC